MSKYKSSERRRHKRLKVGIESAAISIANKEFPILEMSSGGFSSNYDEDSLSFDQEHPTYILLHGLSLIGDVSVQLTWKKRSNASAKNKHTTSNVGFKFSGLKASQQLKLEAFLKWHTEGPVPQHQPATRRLPCLVEKKANQPYTPLACVPQLCQNKGGELARPAM